MLQQDNQKFGKSQVRLKKLIRTTFVLINFGDSEGYKDTEL